MEDKLDSRERIRLEALKLSMQATLTEWAGHMHPVARDDGKELEHHVLRRAEVFRKYIEGKLIDRSESGEPDEQDREWDKPLPGGNGGDDA